jgi:hypothetical protein
MAAEWIKMRLDLGDDPAVIEMAAWRGEPEYAIVGLLHRIWCWASRHCHGGTVTGIEPDALGRITGTGDLPSLMVRVGWLQVGADKGRPTLTFPRWERHLSKGGKERALAAERKARQRARDSQAPADDVTASSQKSHGANVTGNSRVRGDGIQIPSPLTQDTDDDRAPSSAAILNRTLPPKTPGVGLPDDWKARIASEGGNC